MSAAIRRVRGRGQSCHIADCSSSVNARGLCSKHYHHWRKANTTAQCLIEQCLAVAYAGGYCVMHYQRVRSFGAPGTSARLRAEHGSGHVNGEGYRVLHLPAHPLATHRAQGKIEEHRVVLYEAIGAGGHPCNWCGKPLTWRGPADSRLNVDHLDTDRLNNDPANLVPSCLDCNTKRGHAA